jgi:hypothetical protein
LLICRSPAKAKKKKAAPNGRGQSDMIQRGQS